MTVNNEIGLYDATSGSRFRDLTFHILGIYLNLRNLPVNAAKMF